MKRIAALFLSVLLCVTAAGEVSSPLPGDMPDAPSVLEAEDGNRIVLTLPDGYMDFRPETETGFPCRYRAEDPFTGCVFRAELHLESQKARQQALEKLNDPRGSFRVLDYRARVGDHMYLIYTGKSRSNEWHFLLLDQESYAYAFSYSAPESGDTVPQEALDILATLRLVSPDPGEPAALPTLLSSDFPVPQPIDESHRAAAGKQMLSYCRALLTCPALNIPLADDPGRVDWEPPEFAPYPEAYGTVYSVTLWARSPDGGKDEVTVNLRADGSVRDLIYVYGGRFPYDGSGQEYGAAETGEWFSAAYREQAAMWLLQFSDLVWPGSMDRMEAVRFGSGEITGDGCWIMTLYGVYCNPDGTDSFDDPCIVIEVYPEFRLLRYGLGLG